MMHPNKRPQIIETLLCAVGVASSLACSTDSTEGALSSARDSVVFGSDDRIEYGAITDPRDLRLADATGAQFASSNVSCSNGSCDLTTSPYTVAPTDSGWRTLCGDEPLKDQAQGAGCTAFLIGPKHFATAGHCMDCDTSLGSCLQTTCDDSRIVFGFNAAANGGSEVTTVPEGDVYTCVSAEGVYTGTEDFAIFEVDRVVTGRTPMFVRYGGSAVVGDELLVVGHPDGLPLKLADNGEVKEDLGTENMGTSLDAFAGNSGSPVMNALTGVVEGIHVRRPYHHYLYDGGRNCAETNVCSASSGCSPNFGVSAWAQATRFPWLASQVSIPLHPALVTSALL